MRVWRVGKTGCILGLAAVALTTVQSAPADLEAAAHRDDLAGVKALLAAGADAKAANRYGVTPLSLACVPCSMRGRMRTRLCAAGRAC